MSRWGTAKSRAVLKALQTIGWEQAREATGSHRVLRREGWEPCVFAFHDGEEIGPKMLARSASGRD
jgi:predicted RNA binding protein YcfA (HicA-like mRNA interferase family)